MLLEMFMLAIFIALAASLYMHKKNVPFLKHISVFLALAIFGGVLAVFVFYKMAQSLDTNIVYRISDLLVDMLLIYSIVGAIFLALFLLVKIFKVPTATAIQRAQGLLGILLFMVLSNSTFLMAQDFHTKYNERYCEDGEASRLEKPYPSVFQVYFDIPTTSCREH